MTVALKKAIPQMFLLLGAALAWNCGPDQEPSPCGPENCSGCCQSGECVMPQSQSNAACGTTGTECSVCGSAQICTAGKCSEAGSWAVRPLAASVTPNDPRDGTPWDIDNSPPDVVVTIGCPLADGGTDWVETEEVQSYAPTFLYGVCRAAQQDIVDRGIFVDVSDRDLIVDDPIDSFTLLIPPNAFPTQSTVNTESRDGGLISLTISIDDPR